MNSIKTHVVSKADVQTLIPTRNKDAHKGTFGSVAIIGGDAGMVGAVLLAARTALHSGAGRVYAAMLCKNAPVVDLFQPEIMLRSTDAISTLAQLDAIVIGTGLGQSDEAKVLLEVWLAKDVPLLLDADALNLIANYPHLAILVAKRQATTVMTPHAGEAGRLLAKTGAEIQCARVDNALKIATSLHVTCVLKGENTVIAHDDGTYFINETGNVGLASGGTGDVLSGVIGSLMAQGLSGLEAATLGVYVHGAAADALVKNGIGPIGLTASEVILEARNVLNKLSKN
ncbi:MAG TPA: NAD(P)H-hydrate dehydratase [Methylotenera sp.]|nr:NAD(P)H-hydrate dehydratase [Methylotenera sp.]HPH05380.1 NAD(P)H-hydrate dehydratase [Methylotenera sp.]HPN01306.1 NAD(P)H-hydrate dehydratase [Methylotenera sp.]